jgi:hypothetical protein
MKFNVRGKLTGNEGRGNVHIFPLLYKILSINHGYYILGSLA